VNRGLSMMVVALPLLSGCLSLGDEPATAEAPTTPAAAEPDSATAAPVLAAANHQMARAAVAPAPDYPAIDTLKGLSSENIEVLLGAPHFRRRDKPAELWQYRTRKCVLDLFFYPGGGGALAVEYLDVRVGTGQETARQACFVSLLKARDNAAKG